MAQLPANSAHSFIYTLFSSESQVTVLLKLLLTLSLLGFSGCAAMLRGGRQDVFLNSDPQGVRVEVGGVITNTPTSVKLERDMDHPVSFSKEGYEPQTLMITSNKSWFWTITDIAIWGIFIGWLVDEGVGANYNLDPTDVHVRLVEKPKPPPPKQLSAPVAETNQRKQPDRSSNLLNDDFFKKGFDDGFFKKGFSNDSPKKK